MNFRQVIVGVGLLLASLQAQAQEIVTVPIMGSQSTEELTQQPVDDAYRILVIGDALAGGLGAGLSRMAEPEPGFEIVNRFQEVSGLARPEVYDWVETLPKIMDGKNFKAVVVLLGSNDRQSIRDGDFRYVFNTPEWLAAYKAKTDQLLDVLKAAGVKVFWVAIPPMGDAMYEADMQVVAALQKQEVQGRGATYVDLRSAFLNPDGTYTDRGIDDTGEIRKLRDRDGVAFFKQGNNRFGQLLLAEIKRNLGQPPVAPTLTPEVMGTPVAPAAVVEAVPMFGQVAPDGSIVTYQPDRATTVDAPKVHGRDAFKTLISRADIIPGSNAEKLFVDGSASAAPAGRFDDFSAPEQP